MQLVRLDSLNRVLAQTVHVQYIGTLWRGFQFGDLEYSVKVAKLKTRQYLHAHLCR